MSDTLSHADAQNAALDALGAILAAERGDNESVSLLVNAIAAADELPSLAVAAIGSAGHLLRLLSHATNVPVETIAAHVSQSIREYAP